MFKRVLDYFKSAAKAEEALLKMGVEHVRGSVWPDERFASQAADVSRSVTTSFPLEKHTRVLRSDHIFYAEQKRRTSNNKTTYRSYLVVRLEKQVEHVLVQARHSRSSYEVDMRNMAKRKPAGQPGERFTLVFPEVADIEAMATLSPDVVYEMMFFPLGTTFELVGSSLIIIPNNAGIMSKTWLVKNLAHIRRLKDEVEQNAMLAASSAAGQKSRNIQKMSIMRSYLPFGIIILSLVFAFFYGMRYLIQLFDTDLDDLSIVHAMIGVGVFVFSAVIIVGVVYYRRSQRLVYRENKRITY